MSKTEEATTIHDKVKERYGAIARGERTGCGCKPTAEIPAIGYTAQDLEAAGFTVEKIDVAEKVLDSVRKTPEPHPLPGRRPKNKRRTQE